MCERRAFEALRVCSWMVRDDKELGGRERAADLLSIEERDGGIGRLCDSCGFRHLDLTGLEMSGCAVSLGGASTMLQS